MFRFLFLISLFSLSELFFGVGPCFGTTSAFADSITEAPAIEQRAEPIKVTGKRSQRRLPSVSSEFNGEVLSLDNTHETSISRALSEEPAIIVRETGNDNFSSYSIRGQDATQSRFFLEGIPLTDAEFNNDNTAHLPFGSLGKVELYPEGIPTFLAEDGLGGAMNFSLDPPHAKRSQMAVRMGSFDSVRVYGRTPVLTQSGQIHVEYGQSNEDFVYYDDNGTPFNSDDDKYSRRSNNRYRRVSVLPEILLYESATQSLRVFSLNSYRDMEVPGATSAPTVGKLKQFFGLTAIKHKGSLAPHVQDEAHVFARWNREQYQTSETPLSVASSGASDSRDLALGIKSQIKLDTYFPNEMDAVAGLGFESFHIQSELARSDSTEKQRLEVPLGFSARLPLVGSALIVKPAVLSHYYFYSSVGSVTPGMLSPPRSPASYSLLSPRLGIASQVVPHSHLRATVGSYYRAPSMYELYGTPFGITPSPDLTYERAYKGDVGFDLEYRTSIAMLREIRVSYTYGFARTHDLITYVDNSQQSKVAVNVGESWIGTHELSATVESAYHFQMRGALSFLHTENLSDVSYEKGKELPHRPPYRIHTVLGYEHTPFYGNYAVSVMGPTYWDLSNTMRVEKTIEHDINVGWDSRSIGVFEVSIQNLTDVLTASASFGGIQTVDNTTGYLGYPAPGRRVYVSWKYEL